jgi:hypothetical protein
MERNFISLWMPLGLSVSIPGGPWWGVSWRALNPMQDILSACYEFNISAVTHKLNWTLFCILTCLAHDESLSAPFSFSLDILSAYYEFSISAVIRRLNWTLFRVLACLAHDESLSAPFSFFLDILSAYYEFSISAVTIQFLPAYPFLKQLSAWSSIWAFRSFCRCCDVFTGPCSQRCVQLPKNIQ